MKISIIIPVYNEEKTISKILDKITNLNLREIDKKIRKEIIIVNDGSKDKSEKIIKKYIFDNTKNNIIDKELYDEFIYINKENQGKGSALRKGFEISSGDIVTIQDADLEYNPEDFKKLITPIIKGKEKVVYGSRFLKKHKPKYRIYFLGNKFLSFLTKILYNVRITDMETCYKVFRKEVIKSLYLKSNKFDIEPEITSKILRKGIKIKEIPISYSPRSIEEGKKIGWKDGAIAILVLLKNRFI